MPCTSREQQHYAAHLLSLWTHLSSLKPQKRGHACLLGIRGERTCLQQIQFMNHTLYCPNSRPSSIVQHVFLSFWDAQGYTIPQKLEAAKKEITPWHYWRELSNYHSSKRLHGNQKQQPTVGFGKEIVCQQEDSNSNQQHMVGVLPVMKLVAARQQDKTTWPRQGRKRHADWNKAFGNKKNKTNILGSWFFFYPKPLAEKNIFSLILKKISSLPCFMTRLPYHVLQGDET